MTRLMVFAAAFVLILPMSSLDAGGRIRIRNRTCQRTHQQIYQTRISAQTSVNFELYSGLTRTSSVKAAQEETPVINLLKLGKVQQVKAGQESTPEPTAEATLPTVEAFVLANKSNANDPNDQYPVPQINIGGVEKDYKIGDLIELWVKPFDEELEDLESVNYTWTILPVVTNSIWPDDTRILFGTGQQNTTYVAILNASYVFAEKDPDGKFDRIFQRTSVSMVSVKVGSGTGPSPTDPTDPPGPPGPTNPTLSGLSKTVYDWTKEIQRTDSYTETNVKADAVRLAASFRNVASLIQNGTLTDIGSILKKTKENNDAAIESRNNWLPWFTKMSGHLQKSYSDGSIKTSAQFSQAWLDIANGLDAAAI